MGSLGGGEVEKSFVVEGEGARNNCTTINGPMRLDQRASRSKVSDRVAQENVIGGGGLVDSGQQRWIGKRVWRSGGSRGGAEERKRLDHTQCRAAWLGGLDGMGMGW